MRKPMTVRPSIRRFGLLAATAMLLSACATDTSTAPKASQKSPLEVSTALASKGGKVSTLDGVPDGVYTVTIDPTQDQDIALGKSRLVIPANGVCDLLTSGYGAGTWNLPCAPQTAPLTLTITMKGSGSASAQLDFEPALRFNPRKDVELFIYTEKANNHDAKTWSMLYCATSKNGQLLSGNRCIDESLTDPDLRSNVDRSLSMVFRRIKHFSGYVIAGRDDGGDTMAAPSSN